MLFEPHKKPTDLPPQAPPSSVPHVISEAKTSSSERGPFEKEAPIDLAHANFAPDQERLFLPFANARSVILSSVAQEPTLVSISSSSSSAGEVSSFVGASGTGVFREERIIASQNFFAERHSLKLSLYNLHGSGVVLKGCLEELGRVPNECGDVFQDNKLEVLHFRFEAGGSDVGSQHVVRSTAWKIVESFVDGGIWGASELLDVLEARGLARCGWVSRVDGLQQELAELRSLLEMTAAAPDEETDDGVHPWIATLRRTSRELMTPLLSIRDASSFAFDNALRVLSRGGMVSEDVVRTASDSEFISCPYRWPTGRLWAHFDTPFVGMERDKSKRLLKNGSPFSVRLRLPVVIIPTSTDLSNLHLELSGPAKDLGRCVQSITKDDNNVMRISSFGHNEELFEGLFSVMHLANLVHQLDVPGFKHLTLETLEEIVRDFGLFPKPRFTQSIFRALGWLVPTP